MLWLLAAAGTASVMKGNVARNADKANNLLGETRAQVANIVREGKNTERAAKGSLARYMQSLQNQRVLKAAGNRFNSAQEELMRTQDFQIGQSVERQIAASEQMGALVANSAFAGAMGNSTDVLAMTQQLRTARSKQLVEKRNRQVTYEQVKQLAGIMPQAVDSMDQTQTDDGIDMSRDFNLHVNTAGSWVGDFAKGAISAYVGAGLASSLSGVATGSEAVMGANAGPQLGGAVGTSSYSWLDSLRDYGKSAFKTLNL